MQKVHFSPLQELIVLGSHTQHAGVQAGFSSVSR